MSHPLQNKFFTYTFSWSEGGLFFVDRQNKKESKKKKNKNKNRNKADESEEKKDVGTQMATTNTTPRSESSGSMLAQLLVLPPPVRNLVATLQDLLGTYGEVVDPESALPL
jgi:hypothetical protein